ncbi:hypothetical protein LTR95_012886 [Oleoguttula sp. CCFEE 5521]
MALHFIAVGGSGTKPVHGNSTDLSASDVKLIRSLAMRDFRRRQRLGLQAGHQERHINTSKSSNDAWRERRRAKPSERKSVRSVGPTSVETAVDRVMQHDVDQTLSASSMVALQVPEPPAWGPRHADRCRTSKYLSAVAPYASASKHVTNRLPLASTLPLHVLQRLTFTRQCVEAFFPDGACTPLVLDRFLSHCIVEKTDCLQVCNDAVHYLFCGSSTADRSMGLEGRRKHLLALSHLRLEIERPSARIADLVAPINDLLLCEAFRIVAEGGNAWTTHVQALHTVVSKFEQRGQHLEGFLFRQVRHSSLMQALVFRHPIALGPSYWCKRAAPSHGPEALVQLAVWLPALLQEADLACSSEATTQTSAARITLRLMDLEVVLLAWTPTKTTVEAAHVDQDLRLNLDVFGKPVGSAASFVARLSSSFHQCLLLELRSSLLDLKATLHKPTEPTRCLTALVDESAALARDGVNEMIGMPGSPISRGISVRLQIHMLKRWYSRSRDELGLRWLVQTERRLQEELSYINWDALLAISCHALLWLVTKP